MFEYSIAERKMKLAFLFSGQGSQTPGMSAALSVSCDICQQMLAEPGKVSAQTWRGTAMRCAECQAIFLGADSALDFSLSELMERGSADELRRTEITQPAVLTLTVAEAYRLMTQGIQPDMLAGHSLGQYAALVVAGAIDFDNAVRLVEERGRLMQQTVPEGKGMMMAIMGLDRSVIYEACAAARSIGVVSVALHNSPGQTVISGEREAVLAAADRCEEAGGGVVEVPVSVPFHCDLLVPMVPEFACAVDQAGIVDPRLPVIDNVTALPLTNAASVRQSLIKQLTSPVLFEESLEYLTNAGVNHFIQCGSGKSLLNFAQRVSRTAKTETFEQASSAAPRVQVNAQQSKSKLPDYV
jgi:[acyl-carrier-protein] S-malonyltransferase